MFTQGVSWLAIALTGVATFVWLLIVAGGNYCWSAFAFTMMASSVSAGVLLLGVVPSWVRYSRTKQSNDLTTLRLAAYSFLILFAETISLWIIPQWIIQQRGE